MPPVSAFADEFISAVERQTPGRLRVLGLEVFDHYQEAIDRFLATCDETHLLNTPDREALRGHKGKEHIVQSFLVLYRHICAINATRPKAERIRIIAIDSAPDPTRTFAAWRAASTQADLLAWAMGRDAGMQTRIAAAHHTGLTLVFVGSAHIQRSGAMRIDAPTGQLMVTWLGTRLARMNLRLLSVNQNDPDNDCIDGIEQILTAERPDTPTFVDLIRDPIGALPRFRCANELPLPYAFEPQAYTARDHYDAYVFHSPAP